MRRDFRKVAQAAGLAAKEWTPRELRHSFVSLLSDDGMPIEHIARLVGHTSTAVTETVYRQQIRPVIVEGAEAMDRIFQAATPQSRSRCRSYRAITAGASWAGANLRSHQGTPP